MQEKKSPKANLEKQKFLFTEIGLILALALCLLAFEWSTQDISVSSLGDLSQSDLMEEEIDITQQEEEIQEPEPEPEPEPEQEQIIEELVVVEDDVKVDDIKINTEADDKTKIAPQIVASDFGDVEDEEVEPIEFAVVEEKPVFPGDEIALQKFIAQNTVYPPVAKELGVQGRVFVQFVIDKTGKVTKVQIARGVDPALDAEALRVVKLLPNWSPGKQRGKNVPVTFIVPINFKLS
ncbi:energy transducer TonB [Bacteroidales bacterium OttesenSCG-928-I21]|nr:energy transducer TonB [Bacteroidales bacterium OttesenSCG-928-I21]